MCHTFNLVWISLFLNLSEISWEWYGFFHTMLIVQEFGNLMLRFEFDTKYYLTNLWWLTCILLILWIGVFEGLTECFQKPIYSNIKDTLWKLSFPLLFRKLQSKNQMWVLVISQWCKNLNFSDNGDRMGFLVTLCFTILL